MSADTVQMLSLVLAAINTLALPAIAALGKHLWGLNERLLRIELQMGIDRQPNRGQQP